MGQFRRMQRSAMLLSLLALGACGGGGGAGEGAVATADSAKLLVAGTSVELGVPAEDAAVGHGVSKQVESTSTSASGEALIYKPLQRPYSVVDVGISKVTPPRVDATLYERSMMPNTMLLGTAAGNISALQGRTLYLFVKAPLAMFQYAAGGVVTQPEPGVVVGLQGAVLRTAGSYAGALEVLACLDAACATRLRGVPYYVPYAVSVLRSYRLPGSDQEQIAQYEVQLPPAVFGQAPPVGQLVVVPPERAPFSTLTATVQRDPSGGPWGFDSRQPTASFIDNGNGRVTVSAQLSTFLPPTVYAFTVLLGSTHRVGDNSSPPSFAVRFTQEVRPDPALPMQFDPPQLNLTVTSTGIQSAAVGFQGVSGQVGGTVAYEGVEYLFTPEQEALIPAGPRALLLTVAQPSGWRPSVAFGQSVGAHNCINWWDGSATSTYCLPPGSYAFRLRYRLTSLGASTSTFHYLPGTIQVVP